MVLTSTYHEGGATAYARDGNPTWDALESAVGGLEGGKAVAFASGLAAIAAVLEALPVPGRVVVAGDAYNGTRRLLADVAGRGRLRFATVDTSDTRATLALCAEIADSPGRPIGAGRSRSVEGSERGFGDLGLLWVESPTNPLLAVADIAALCEGAHHLGLDVAVDNTFATPLRQRPLDLGADVVVHSATKLLSGHSDLVLGMAVARRPEVLDGLVRRRSLHGAVPGPWEAWLALRGLRTLDVRLERAERNAGILAARLAEHPAVTAVHYPGLGSDPGHELASTQMLGFGTIVSFEVAGGADAAERIAGCVTLATAATSLGGVETLIERRGRWEGEGGLPGGLLRLSVGIEGVEDLWADLDQALGR